MPLRSRPAHVEQPPPNTLIGYPGRGKEGGRGYVDKPQARLSTRRVSYSRSGALIEVRMRDRGRPHGDNLG